MPAESENILQLKVNQRYFGSSKSGPYSMTSAA